MLYAIIILLLLIVAWLGYRHIDVMKREKGLDEIEEGYQAEIMTQDEQLENARERLHNVYEAHRLLRDDFNALNKENESLHKRVDPLEQELATKSNLLIAVQEGSNEKQILLDAATEDMKKLKEDKIRLADVLGETRTELDRSVEKVRDQNNEIHALRSQLRDVERTWGAQVDGLQEQLRLAKTELQDVQQAALEMQIDLAAKAD